MSGGNMVDVMSQGDLPLRRTAIAQVAVAALVVWALAVVFGLWSPLAGAAVAVVGAFVAFVLLRRSGVLERAGSLVSFKDPGVLAVLLIAATPLVPARLGFSYAGISLDDIPFLLGTLIALWSVIRTEGWSKLIHPVSIPMWLFAVWNGLAVLIAGNPTLGEVTRGVGRWGLVALAFSLLLRISSRPNMPRVVIGAVLTVGLVEALFGLWAYLVDWMVQSTEVARLIGLELWKQYQPLYELTPGRIAGTLGISSNFFGALMIIPTVLSAVLFVRSRSRFTTAVSGVVTGVLFFALILSYTRASVVGVVAGFLILIALTRRWRLVGLVAGLLVLGVVLTPIASRFINESNDRLALTQKAVETVRAHPVTGLGSGDYVSGQFDTNNPVLIATPHDSFLLAATETGIPGGALLLAGVLMPGIIAAIGVMRGRGGILLAGSVAALFGFGLQTVSNSLFHIPSVAASYWLVAAAAVALARGAVNRERRAV